MHSDENKKITSPKIISSKITAPKITSPKIKSPCVKICVIDTQTKLCIGCGRQKNEIAKWKKMEQKERDQIIKLLPQRLREMTKNRKRKGRRKKL